MNTTLRNIIQSQEVRGSFMDYLSSNPKDFLILIKEDIALAQAYTQTFSPGHIKALLRTSHQQGIKILTEIVDINHTLIKMPDDPFLLKNKTEAELEIYRKEFQHVTTREFISIDQGYGEEKMINHVYYYNNRKIYLEEGWEYTPENLTLKYYTEAFKLAYHQYKHPAWAMNQKSALLSSLVNKLNAADLNTSPLDAELATVSLYSRVFNRSSNIFDSLMKNNEYLLIGKLISLLSPDIAIRELFKPRLASNLLDKMIDYIPHNAEPMTNAINRMQVATPHIFEQALSSCPFNVVKRVQQHSPDLAYALFQSSPEYIEREFNITLDDILGPPPAYDEEPANRLGFSGPI